MFRQSIALAIGTLLILTGATVATAGTEVPITRIDFAGAGGDFHQRQGTFVVPDRDTTVSAYGGSLRRYDVHIAKMIEVTAAVWCPSLNLVSERYKDSIVIMQVDQAGAHRAKRLQMPTNIILLFQPSHSPETNPIERVWQHFKLGLRWQLPKDLDALRLLMRARLEAMTQEVIASIVGWHSILEALSVAGL